MLKNYRVNVHIVCEALLLLAVTLGVLAWFSHKALHQEALRSAEQMLEGTVQNIDNILMSVEQSAGNMYFDVVEHLDNPDRMHTYSRELVESNPNIAGCAIVFKPGYYAGKDLFMAYVHRASGTDDKSALVTAETFTNRPYTEQVWYAEPMKTGWAGWIDPLKGTDTENEPLITFCLPLKDRSGARVGVLAVDVSIDRLSKIVLAAKPSENGYCLLLAHNGSYIVHPDKEKLTNPLVFSHKNRAVDASETDAAKEMLAGKKGMREFRKEGRNWFVFYKPLERVGWEGWTKGVAEWSAGVVCPEDDILGKNNTLLYQVVAIAIVGILLFFLLCSWIIRMQLKPMKKLAESAEHIAGGDFSEMLPPTDRLDEIGLLQKQFRKMQHSLRSRLTELEEETERLHQQGDMLRTAYDKTLENDVMKTSFQHYMTNQMLEPIQAIHSSVTTLCNNVHDSGKDELDKQTDNIEQKSLAVLDLTSHLAHFTEVDTGKEADHD